MGEFSFEPLVGRAWKGVVIRSMEGLGDGPSPTIAEK